MGKIGEYLSTYVNKGTRTLIYSSIKHFLISIYGGDKKRSDEEWETLAEQYFSECRARKRDWFKDLLNYVTYLAEKERPPASIYGYVNSAKNWITYTLDLDLTPKQRKILKNRVPKGKRARTDEDDLTREKLKKILTHCDTKGRALFLFLASSGIRIGEALQLRMSDIDLEHDPPKVTVRGEYAKEGDKYITFISKEAKTALEEWLKIREEYLRQAFQKGRGLERTRIRPEEDDRVFPFSKTVVYEMWTNEMLESYLNDLKTAQKNGRNLLIEKYARMDNLIPPLNTNPLIDKIVEIETMWQEEIRNKYPAIYNRVCRSTDPARDGSNFSIYLQCELETYSDNTLELYYKNSKSAFDRGENLALRTLERLVKKGGYNDLDHAEKLLK